jgi:hypothetical protein
MHISPDCVTSRVTFRFECTDTRSAAEMTSTDDPRRTAIRWSAKTLTAGVGAETDSELPSERRTTAKFLVVSKLIAVVSFSLR